MASEAPLSPAQQAALPDPVVTVPVASGALAIIYHVPGVPAGLELSSTVLAEIFLGQITSWNSSAITALNPNMTFPAALPITTVHGSGESGSNYVFTAYLSSVSPAWSERVGQGETVNWSVGTTANGSLAMEQAVENTSGAIGFVGLNVAEGGSASVARVQNPAGNFITPTSASISAAFQDVPSNGLPLGNGDWSNVSELAAPGPESYPISTFSYVLDLRGPGTCLRLGPDEELRRLAGDVPRLVGLLRAELLGLPPLCAPPAEHHRGRRAEPRASQVQRGLAARGPG